MCVVTAALELFENLADATQLVKLLYFFLVCFIDMFKDWQHIAMQTAY